MKTILSNEIFDQVYSELTKIYGDAIVEDFYVLPNVPKVLDLIKEYNYQIKEQGTKWLLVPLKGENFDFCDKLDDLGLLPIWGFSYNYSEFIND